MGTYLCTILIILDLVILLFVSVVLRGVWRICYEFSSTIRSEKCYAKKELRGKTATKTTEILTRILRNRLNRKILNFDWYITSFELARASICLCFLSLFSVIEINEQAIRVIFRSVRRMTQNTSIQINKQFQGNNFLSDKNNLMTVPWTKHQKS